MNLDEAILEGLKSKLVSHSVMDNYVQNLYKALRFSLGVNATQEQLEAVLMKQYQGLYFLLQENELLKKQIDILKRPVEPSKLLQKPSQR